MKKATFVMLAALLMLGSCATYRTYSVPEPAIVPYSTVLHGKTLSILPVKIVFENSRGLTVGFDSVKVGDVYTKRYATEEDNMILRAKVGILQRNIMQKKVTSSPALSALAADLLKRGALGTYDYRLAYIKGLGSGKMGELSNRPMEYDYSVSPAAVAFKPATTPVSYFSKVMVVGIDAGATAADYYLETELRLDNEIVQVLAEPAPMSGQFERSPKLGDYYVSVNVFVSFKLYDARTNAVVATERTKLFFPVSPGSRTLYYIPIDKPDDFYNLDAFLRLDYSEYARKAIEKVMPSLFPYVAPFIANVQYIEKVEK